MKLFSLLAVGCVLTVSALAASAQIVAPPSGETLIQLDVSSGIRPTPPSRVTVPNGEVLRVAAPSVGSGISYVWTKNGRAIPGASQSTLTIEHVVSSDAGTYTCLYTSPSTMPGTSQALVLGVGPTDRLLNVSTRAFVGGNPDQALVTGFVVAANTAGKKLIVRAIGPSLTQFGVANALRAPVLKIYDGNGRLYENGYVYPAVVGGPSYESDLAYSLASAGAFPLPSGSRDAVVMMPFLPGSYTAQVTSGDGSTGTVLLEVYEVP